MTPDERIADLEKQCADLRARVTGLEAFTAETWTAATSPPMGHTLGLRRVVQVVPDGVITEPLGPDADVYADLMINEARGDG